MSARRSDADIVDIAPALFRSVLSHLPTGVTFGDDGPAVLSGAFHCDTLGDPVEELPIAGAVAAVDVRPLQLLAVALRFR